MCLKNIKNRLNVFLSFTRYFRPQPPKGGLKTDEELAPLQGIAVYLRVELELPRLDSLPSF
jgi:hypothetical protein